MPTSKGEITPMSPEYSARNAGTINIGRDLTVNRLGYGAMRLTGPGIWGEPRDRDEAKKVLRRASDLGVTFIDTADSYGPAVSETLIAEALHPYPDDLVIATKGGLERTGPGKWPVNGRPEHLVEACHRSLRRLRLEQILVYQLHRPDPNVPLSESLGALVELKEQGKIRHIGLSNVTERQLREAQRLTPIVSIQNRFNLSDRSSESLLDLCEQEQLVFLPWAPIQDLDRNRVVQDVATRHQATVSQVVLAWLLARSPQMLPIPGTGSVDHLEENIAAAGLVLDPAEVTAVTHSAQAASARSAS
jgi:pyridoxine 4-dehydrogenase